MGLPIKPNASRIWLLRKRSKLKCILDIAVSEQDESRRSYLGLRHVVNADAFIHGHAGSLEVYLLQELVHLAGADALAALAGN